MIPGFVSSLLAGMAAGLGVLAAYAYGTAELFWSSRVAGHVALAVPPAATLMAIVITAAFLRWCQVRGRVLLWAALATAAILTYALGHVLRVLPPAELHTQLPGYLDATPDLAVIMSAVQGGGLPMIRDLLPPEATWLYLAIEVVLLFLAALFLRDAWLTAPYCHACRRFCRRRRGVAALAPAAPAQAISHVQARDWTFFRALGPKRARRGAHLRFDTASCISCNRMHTVSLTLARAWWPDTPLIRDARLAEDDLRTIKSLGRP